MFIRILPLLVLLMIAGAYWSRESHDVVVIERLEIEGRELAFIDWFDPVYAGGYPETVATVNGRSVTGQDLAIYEVSRNMNGSDSDMLEWIIDLELLAQASERLGHRMSYKEGMDFAEGMEPANRRRASEDEMAHEVELALARGWPTENWAESEIVVESFRRSRGIADTQLLECHHPTLEELNAGVRSTADCSAFLAAERENAVIEYFVVWAE